MLRAVSVVPFQAIAMRSPSVAGGLRRRDENRPAAFEEDGLEGRFARQPHARPGPADRDNVEDAAVFADARIGYQRLPGPAV